MAKLPVKTLSLAECLATIDRMAAVHNSMTDGQVQFRFKLGKDAIENFKINVIHGENYHVGLEAISPAAQHYVEQVHKRHELQCVLEQRVMIDKTMDAARAEEVMKGYDNFGGGSAHSKFYKHETVPYLLALSADAAIRKIMLEYPQHPDKRAKWLAKNEAALDAAFKEPMGTRTERLLSKLVHWIYFEQHGNKFEASKAKTKPVKVEKEIGTIKPAKPKVIDAPKLPGDNQLAAAFKKAKLFTEPAATA